MRLYEFGQIWHGSDLYSKKGAPKSSTKCFDILFKKALESKRGGKILEIGSGRGGALEKLKQYSKSSPIGTDINPVFIKNIRNSGFEAHIVNAEETLPFNDLEFDVVYSDQVLEHVTCPAKFLDEIRKVLKNDGHLLLVHRIENMTSNIGKIEFPFILTI